MDAAVVTGASRGCGLAIAQKLIALKVEVYGLARDFSTCPLSAAQFHQIECDITDTKRLVSTLKDIINKPNKLTTLVNNAGVGAFGPHETLRVEEINRMVLTNLLAPMLLTHTLLRTLRENKGTIINISSTAAIKAHRFGCAYAATKAGLAQFGHSLLQEVRKSGVKVVTIFPDVVQSSFHDQADFRPGPAPDNHLEPACVAEAVAQILSQPEGSMISQLVLEPQRPAVEKKKRGS